MKEVSHRRANTVWFHLQAEVAKIQTHGRRQQNGGCQGLRGGGLPKGCSFSRARWITSKNLLYIMLPGVINTVCTPKNLWSAIWIAPLLYCSLTFEAITISPPLSLSPCILLSFLFLATYQKKKSDGFLVNYGTRVLVCQVLTYLSPFALPLQMLSMFSLKTMLFHFLKTTMPPKNNLFIKKGSKHSY